ncbi:hypothetical protein MMC22_010441 [Lobaria immixta]|nr:hypothetical protein [Lobaria immixta]
MFSWTWSSSKTIRRPNGHTPTRAVLALQRGRGLMPWAAWPLPANHAICTKQEKEVQGPGAETRYKQGTSKLFCTEDPPCPRTCRQGHQLDLGDSWKHEGNTLPWWIENPRKVYSAMMVRGGCANEL